MASNMNARVRKETAYTNAQGETERRIETVDYQTSAWQGQEVRNVEVIHQSHDPMENSNTTSGGTLASSAAEAVASTIQSAKDVISGK